MAVINERLDTSTVFLRPDNHGPLMNITKSLGQIKNMRAVMINLKKGVSSGLSKGGGIKNGIWSTLRSVRELNISASWVLHSHCGDSLLSMQCRSEMPLPKSQAQRDFSLEPKLAEIRSWMQCIG